MSPTQAGQNSVTKKRDWSLFVMGVVVFLIGGIILLWPETSWYTLVLIAGVFLIIEAIFSIVIYVRYRSRIQGAGWIIANAVINVILGLMFLIHPVIAGDVIPWVVGIFSLIYGVMAIFGGIFMRDSGSLRWVMIVGGIVGILCGILFISVPILFVIFLGAFFLVRGISIAIFALTGTPALSES